MEELITSIKNRIELLEREGKCLEVNQKSSITITLRGVDKTLKELSLLCMAIKR